MAAMQPGPQAIPAIKLMQGFDLLVRDFLEEMEIPNAELVNPDLTQDLVMAQQMVQMQQAQAAGQVQPGGPEGPPGAPGVPSGPLPPGGPPQGPGAGPQGPPPGPPQG